ncbi:MAG: glycosyltransferase [Schwartzia sp.]|nr:glycosyltransferase [Schwartzia sp. (in: firmicutes)]MBR1886307.1 glycosyltransferase [Schwartzia sp. (in: firmicutes)]
MLKVTACVIVKNEEKNLPHWIACVKAIADELVVVDTGSTDRTTELAQAAGAKLFSFAWRDDFAAAKNFALQKARGNWIVFLDADEYFSEPDLPKVKAYIQNFDKEQNTAGFICPWINIDVDKGGAILTEGVQLRVFRRHPDIRYQGHIHEMLQMRSPHWKVEQVRDVRIWHTGYSTSVMRGKAERDFAILLSERERRGEAPSDAFYLADCCYALGRYGEALDWARKAIASGYTLGGRESRPYDVLLNSMLALRRPFQEVCKAARKAFDKFPEIPDYRAIEGVSAWQAKDYVRAESALLEALSMAKEGAGHIRAVILGHLADIAHRRGKDAQALDYAVDAVKEDRFYEPAVLLLGKILRALPSADVIRLLNTIYDPSADAEFLVRVLAKNGLYEVCLYYDHKAEKPILSSREKFFYAGAYAKAAYEDARSLARSYAMQLLAARRTQQWEERSRFLPELVLVSEGDSKDGFTAEVFDNLSRMEKAFPWE